MKNKTLTLLTAAALSLGATAANAASCDDPLRSQLGQASCYKLFNDLAAGTYNVSFQYQAEKTAGTSDRNLHFGFLFGSETLSLPKVGLLSDSTSTTGWNTYSFVTQAAGDAALAFSLIGLYPRSYGIALQNIQVSAVPEPATYAMLLAGLGAMVFVSRRRKI